MRVEPGGRLLRLAAFTTEPPGGNPAGVWIGEALPSVGEMQRIATEVGFSETAFVAPAHGRQRIIRYYSPAQEISFCGHATIATGVVLGDDEGDGTYLLDSAVGVIPVTVQTQDGRRVASLTSVATASKAAPQALLDEVLELLGWSGRDLDPSIPPSVAFAGAWHLILAVREASRLATLEYDLEALAAVMRAHDLTTLQLIWREGPDSFQSRNPFAIAGVFEDPATGASAAALGGYLRDAGLMTAPFSFEIRQGEAMGRPSRLRVAVPAVGGVVVTGNAIPIRPEQVAGADARIDSSILTQPE